MLSNWKEDINWRLHKYTWHYLYGKIEHCVSVAYLRYLKPQQGSGKCPYGLSERWCSCLEWDSCCGWTVLPVSPHTGPMHSSAECCTGFLARWTVNQRQPIWSFKLSPLQSRSHYMYNCVLWPPKNTIKQSYQKIYLQVTSQVRYKCYRRPRFQVRIQIL